MADHLGSYNTSSSRTRVGFQFTTSDGSGGAVAPSDAFEAADIRIYRAADGAAFSATQRSSSSGITMTSPFDSVVGLHSVDIDLTDNTDAGFYAAGYRYAVVLSPDTETVDGQTVVKVLAYFEIGPPQVNVTQLGGVAQSATDLKDFADTGYDPATHKVAGVVLVDTLTTYTSNTPQTGDTYARFNTMIELDGAVYRYTYPGNTVQTGDAYARLGAPAGASHAADVAAVKTDTGNLVTRITSSLFSGITSLAQWLGLLAGKQTGNSTARTEVRATGAGSGTFDETTDSQEALRDSLATAAGVWDMATSGHTTSGTFGAAAVAAGGAGDPWSTSLPGSYGAGTAGYIVGNNLDAAVGGVPTNAELATALAAADDAVLAAIAALNNLSAAQVWAAGTRTLTAGTNIALAKGVGVTGFNDLSAAQVNAEVVDVLSVDTFAELSADPGASPTVVKALMLLYMALRNKVDITATAKKIHNNAGTAVLTKTLSDDGTTYSESKVA